MARGPLFQGDYKPQFSGHETFPLRYGWLKKVFDRVAETENKPDNRNVCWDDGAIARFGVGKNMVASMRHWAKASGIIEEPTETNAVRPTELGCMLFGPDGLDPYMEHPATLWLIHWQLATYPEKTTWFWAFSHYPAITFDRDSLIRKLERLIQENQSWPRISENTIKNDVACFIRTYVARQASGKMRHDDVLESPLTELGLIKAIGKQDGFRFVRGPKSTLGDGVFVSRKKFYLPALRQMEWIKRMNNFSVSVASVVILLTTSSGFSQSGEDAYRGAERLCRREN